jgi:hypothetical protein
MKISNFIVNEQIQEKLETNNFLKFYRLIARIPKAFKDCLKENLLDIHFDTTDTFVKKIVKITYKLHTSVFFPRMYLWRTTCGLW